MAGGKNTVNMVCQTKINTFIDCKKFLRAQFVALLDQVD